MNKDKDKNGNEENRARVLVASAAQVQLKAATEMLRSAVGNLEALRFGTLPALENAKAALRTADAAAAQVELLIKRIP